MPYPFPLYGGRVGIPLVVATTILLAACQPVPRPNDLRTRLETLIGQFPGAEVGLAVRDAAHDYTLDLNGDLEFHAASTMKVPVLIELYRQSAAGRFSLDDSIRISNEFTSIYDGSAYSIAEDSDTQLYSMLGESMSIRDLAYRMITSSSNLATNLLVELVSPDSIQATIERLGTRRMHVLRGVEDLKAFEAGMNNTTTASDLAVLLEQLRAGTVVSQAASAEMRAIMADVPIEMILPGSGDRGEVAHKTGMITAHHHDAGIVYPGDGEPYVIVILTRGLDQEDASMRLGREISAAVYRHLRG